MQGPRCNLYLSLMCLQQLHMVGQQHGPPLLQLLPDLLQQLQRILECGLVQLWWDGAWLLKVTHISKVWNGAEQTLETSLVPPGACPHSCCFAPSSCSQLPALLTYGNRRPITSAEPTASCSPPASLCGLRDWSNPLAFPFWTFISSLPPRIV